MLARFRKRGPEPLPAVDGDSFAARLLRQRTDLLRELVRHRVRLDAVLYVLDQALEAATVGEETRHRHRRQREREVVLRSFRDWAEHLRALCREADLAEGDAIAALLSELDVKLGAASRVHDEPVRLSGPNVPFQVKGPFAGEWPTEASRYLRLLYVPAKVARLLVTAVEAEAARRRVRPEEEPAP